MAAVPPVSTVPPDASLTERGGRGGGPALAPGRVLPTLNEDGSRVRLRPKVFPGKHFQRRRWVAWGLMALFLLLPFIKVGNYPAMLINLPQRRFHLMGATFYATDGVLLMLLLLSVMLSVFLVTALFGRAWCGWACPQTVYLEFLYRPIERWFERGVRTTGRTVPGGWRSAAKNGVFLLLSLLLGNIFISYFVGVDSLWRFVRQSPLEHPTPFLVMAVTTAMVFFDFAYFREQMCTVACPYARLQAALFDRRSLLIGYDAARGEPRGKVSKRDASAVGDCVNCGACVLTCPTGIDIREGLQLECVACAQCVDACDSVMAKLKRPLGLIRYGSQDEFATGRRPRLLRLRVAVYAVILTGVIGALITLKVTMGSAEVTVLRGLATPYVVEGEVVRNLLRVKIENRAGEPHRYHIALAAFPEATLVVPENPVLVKDGASVTTGVFVSAPKSAFHLGRRDVELVIEDEAGFRRVVQHHLLGPYR